MLLCHRQQQQGGLGLEIRGPGVGFFLYTNETHFKDIYKKTAGNTWRERLTKWSDR